MILIINNCMHEMHYHEFIRPIEDILRKNEVPFDTVHYSKISSVSIKKMASKYHRIILSGTSLKDMDYSKNISRFKPLASLDIPILGICGGMQILCMINGCKLFKRQEIGQQKIIFTAEFLGIDPKKNSSREAYSLHNMAIKDEKSFKDNFKIYAKSNPGKYECIQAVKHKKFRHYGTLFHPEVRNKDLIVNFLYV